MRSYEAARGVFNFLGICSWGVIVIGGIVALMGAASSAGIGRSPSGAQALLAALPGIGLVVMGFVGLAMTQLGRAGVDTAEYSQQALDVARKQLEVSQRMLTQGAQMAATYAALVPKRQSAAEHAPAPADTEAPDHGASYAGQTAGQATAVAAAGTAIEDASSEAQPALPETAAVAALPEPGIEVPVAELLEEPVAVAKLELIEEDGLYKYGSLSFSSREKANAYLSQLGVNPNAKT